MHETLQEASEELKRADHLIYVSLKYTRTVDVIKNIIERLVNAYDLMAKALLETKLDEGKIKSVPASPLERVDEVKKFYGEEGKTMENMELYLLLRKIATAEFERSKEFRRHVTMTAKMKDGTEILVDIDKIYDYNDMVKEFFNFVASLGDKDND